MQRRLFIFKLLIIILFNGLFLRNVAQENALITLSPEERWADSVLNTFSTDEMIGQLMIVRANVPNQPYFDVIERYIKDYNLGGVTFFGGHPALQALQTNRWQSMAKTPMFISIDGEWGPAMRLDSILSFPYLMTAGAAVDDSLMYFMGMEVARQCKRLGIQINFAPVVDINSNPDNPVIHMRSLGEDREKVAAKGIMYMKGMQDGGLIVTAKHFPGHGDTGTDSHYTLPVVPHSRQRLDSLELYPFRKLIEAGLDGIMIAHLFVPAVENSPNTPSTLSKAIVTDLLRGDLGFGGLIVTDALDMKGVTLNDQPGEIEVKALKAGNDILLLSANVPEAVKKIKEAIEHGDLPLELIRERCRKVLLYKYKAGLNRYNPVELTGLYDDLNKPSSELVCRNIFEQSVTLVHDDHNMLPVTGLDSLKIASVSTGYGALTPFQERLGCYAPVDHFFLKKEPTDEEIIALKKKIAPYNLVILSVQNTSIWGGSPYGISPKIIQLIGDISRSHRVILDLFASPYALRLIEKLPEPAAILLSYQDHPLIQDISAQAIFGGTAISGRLPVTAGNSYPAGTGKTTSSMRLKYTIPEELALDRTSLAPIDSIISDAISKKAFPGCQVFAANDGKVFFSKSYGYHTYTNEIPVKNSDIYDIASLTKIAATTLAVMRLADEGKIDVDRKVETYLPDFANTDKGNIVVREMMAHQARLRPWIPFYKATLKDGKPDSAFYRSTRSDKFPVRVAENLFLTEAFDKIIFDSIKASSLLKSSQYKYSDLGFILLTPIIKNLTGLRLDSYAGKEFYLPLGLSTTGYNPRERFDIQRIPPTENDTVFRRQLIRGDVHDQCAAMIGGVSGHAGLFSNANDLGIIAQMLLNRGIYGGNQYLSEEIIGEFTRMQFPLNDNRRGLGFDRPLPVYAEEGPCCRSASQSSYGHSGFTGTYIWVDPESELTFVFLSNRVYPNAENNKLSAMNIRPKIHQVFYDALEKRSVTKLK
ncbi:MAG TPA: glycoside hydrolase family 3 N-terminal domain-containing protein [Bacteroidales bacterium]|nr:glycoside hydrolase family 3 N-terminal domain-containing protein [Bacteroidales bacterium]HPM92918.1 glycoside hydrolase family 3 N-terminal domain-containing protein [Bacteroidales bacterium]